MHIIRFLKWPFLIAGILAVAAVLNFFLPSKDVVRIVGVEVTRMDGDTRKRIEENAGTLVGNRDVRFINAVWPSRKPRVYRNEDTGWGFPWYFKFDSGNLQAEAQDSVSTGADPRWFVVNHYGWRITILDMFPNAISIKEVPGPDFTPIPWFNIVFLSLMALLFITIWRFVLKLRRRHVDPVLEDIQENFDDAMTSAADATADVRTGLAGLYDRWQRWLDTWRSKDKRRG